MSALATTALERICTGDIIRCKRRELGLSARALSLRAGLSAAYVFKVEKGVIEPSLRSFARLAVALGMNTGEVWVCVAHEAASHGPLIEAPATATQEAPSGV